MGAVTTLYEARVAAGDLSDDPAQRLVLPLLDRVSERLGQLSDPVSRQPDKAASGWRGWFRRGADAAETAEAEAPLGLYLWGGVGRGKSMLMDLLAEAAPIRAKRRVHFHAFMREIHAGLEQARKDGAQDAVRPVANKVADEVRLLCFDEMQITDIADAMIVGRLFEYLFERGVVVVTTSNRVPEDLYKNGLNRQLFLPFIDLIRQRMEVADLDSPRDHRQDRLTGAQVWFSPLNADSRAEMNRIWADLTRHGAAEPLILQVSGRRVELGSHSEGNARLSFWDLCGQALGPGDYLALADAVDVLMIDEIPQLSSERFNEAKRFVTAIDAFYEARIRVISSAQADPEKLFVEGEGAFEFERTASRLREMQDANWGVQAD